MTNNQIFQERLATARKLRELNQDELAERTGLQPAAISHFETGARKPSFDNLRKLADALRVTSDYLMGRTDNLEGFAEADMVFRDEYKKLNSEQRELADNFIKMLSYQKKGE